MSKEGKIFLVEDDLNFGAVLKAYLELNDFEVVLVSDGARARSVFKPKEYNLCVLDIMLPNLDGYELASFIRATDSQVPFVFLTAKSLKEDVVKGFDLGADDYITKPFDSEVLLLKIKAILRRNDRNSVPTPTEAIISIGSYTFDTSARTLTKGETKFNLSPKEADLLELLWKNQNRVLSKDKALEKLWGNSNYFTARSMDVYISKLRKYFAEDSDIEIITVHSSGFILRIR
ncbi:MAG: DNA-binding response regulator [Bacteroidales bacterium]|nr:MAG: DNA-binding response regulator [Bacteroidales bacterium]